MRHLNRHPLRRQHGMSLIEVLLAVSIAAVMLGGMTRLMGDLRQEMSAQATAGNMRSFMSAAQHYFEANHNELLQAMADGTKAAEYCRLGVEPDGTGGSSGYSPGQHTCAFDASLLKARLLLNKTFREVDSHGNRLVAILRHIHVDDEPTGNAELLIVSADGEPNPAPARHDFNLAVVSHLGFAGGLIPDRDLGACNGHLHEVCGNGWKVSLQDFVDNTHLTQYSAQLLTP